MNRTNLSSHLPILGSSSFCLASFQNLPRWLTVSIHLSAPRRDCQSLGPCGRGGHETATVLPLCATTLKIDLCLLSQVRWVPLMGQLIHIECSVCLYKGYYITNPKNSFSEANHWTLPYICILWSLQYGQLNDPCHTLSLSLSTCLWFQYEWTGSFYVWIEPDLCGNCDSWAFHRTCTNTPYTLPSLLIYTFVCFLRLWFHGLYSITLFFLPYSTLSA